MVSDHHAKPVEKSSPVPNSSNAAVEFPPLVPLSEVNKRKTDLENDAKISAFFLRIRSYQNGWPRVRHREIWKILVTSSKLLSVVIKKCQVSV